MRKMKRLIKFRLPYLFAAAFLLLCIGISCSEDPTWTKPTPEQEEIIPAVFIEDLVTTGPEPEAHACQGCGNCGGCGQCQHEQKQA